MKISVKDPKTIFIEAEGDAEKALFSLWKKYHKAILRIDTDEKRYGENLLIRFSDKK